MGSEDAGDAITENNIFGLTAQLLDSNRSVDSPRHSERMPIVPRRIPQPRRSSHELTVVELTYVQWIIYSIYPRPLSEQVPCFYCKTHNECQRKCDKCNIAVYCGNGCRKAHWSKHKSACENFTKKKKGIVAILPKPKSRGRRDARGNKSVTVLRRCLSCDTLKSKLIQCSKCHVAEYCDRVCKARHHEEHRPGCETNQWRSKTALLLKIVFPFRHLFEHGAYVQDVNGNEAEMLFFLNQSDEQKLDENGSRLLAKGNYIRWFYPRWRVFSCGKVGFRVDSLGEVEFIQQS